MIYSRRAFLGSSLPAALLADGRAEGRKVVVAAELQPAAAAGVKVVQAGGNAMDAAAAACLVTGSAIAQTQVERGKYLLSVAKNITSDPEQGLGKWTDAEIERAIRAGNDKDGHSLKPPMGYGYYSNISADDMAALIAWLHSLPAKKTP